MVEFLNYLDSSTFATVLIILAMLVVLIAIEKHFNKHLKGCINEEDLQQANSRSATLSEKIDKLSPAQREYDIAKKSYESILMLNTFGLDPAELALLKMQCNIAHNRYLKAYLNINKDITKKE